MTKLCLTLMFRPTVEEKLIDLLLSGPSDHLFSSFSTAVHGLDTASLGATERVLGRAEASQIQILLQEDELEPLLNRLRQELPGAKLRYWATPVLLEGEIT